MNRPYIICHMLTSYNNKISGNFMFSPETSSLVSEYVRIDRDFKAEAWLCGKTTMEEFTGHLKPDSNAGTVKYPRTDFAAKKDAPQYVVVTDPNGEIGYEKAYLEKGGRKSYIVALLTEQVKDTYLSYLRKKGISYIFAGEQTLDLRIAMQKLKSLLGINLLVSHGGGYTNGMLLKENLIDELSLVRVPLVEDNEKEVSLFGNIEISPDTLILKSTIPLTNGGEWLRYSLKQYIR